MACWQTPRDGEVHGRCTAPRVWCSLSLLVGPTIWHTGLRVPNLSFAYLLNLSGSGEVEYKKAGFRELVAFQDCLRLFI